MINILYIGNHLTGGLPTGVSTLSVNLRREGYEVVTASSKKKKAARLGEMLWQVWKYRKWADYVLIDTYSTWNFWYAVAVARLCGRLGLRYIPILHGGDLPGRLRRSPRASRRLFGKAYVNVAPSGFLVEEFSGRDAIHRVQRAGEGVPADGADFGADIADNFKVVFIPNSIDLSNYAFKARINVSPKLFWVRAFQDLYEPLMALKTLQQLLPKYPDAELCMVGPDKDGSLQQCRAYAEEHGLPVTFPGKLSKSAWTQLAESYDLFLNTSRVDNTPLSLIEAMALGLPVISTRAGGIPYMISDGGEGLLVPIGDAGAMVDAVQRLVEDPALAAQLSTTARKKVEAFDWEVVKEQWFNLLK